LPRRDKDAKRQADNAYILRKSQHSRDIARDYPPPGDLARRKSCELDLRRFCESYFPNAFALPWCPDHLKAIGRLEEVTLRGGLFALAMPRGSGKTAISVRAAIWALLYGHRRFVCLVGATKKHAEEILKTIKTELTYNDELVRDFRQVCYPLVRLENNARKRVGQLFDGRQTRIEWTADRLTFPVLPAPALDGPDVGGSTVTVASITGALRGQSSTLHDGTILRPELVILDDPQTRESAASPQQNADRIATVKGDVLGMAGPGRKIAAVMPCTVIREADMASDLLDRKKNPEWSGQLTKMLYAFPADEGLWDRYWSIRGEAMEAGRGVGECNEFYAERREAMDLGALVAWPERFEPDEISGVQHAMNLLFRDRHAFFAEYQNEPLPPEGSQGVELSPDAILAKINRVPRRAVPAECGRLTAMIDVQQELLYFAVCAWEDDFTGAVIDYGTFPDQKRPYFALDDARETLSRLHPSAGIEGRIFAGLEAATELVLGREWPRADGAALKIERCLIDAGKWTDTILKFCRESKHAAILTPSHGQFFGPDSKPMREYRPEAGGRQGFHWRMPGAVGRRAVRHVNIDTNFYKSFVHGRLGVARGDRGSLSLFGSDPKAHRMLADHLTAEGCFPQISEKTGRRVEVWRLKPGRPDNHLFDCFVGCCVAASMQGVALAESTASAAPRRRRLSMAEMKAQRRP
jgi:hypothetical protein